MSRSIGVFFDLDGTLVDLNPDPFELEELRAKIMAASLKAGVSPKSRSIFGTYQQVLKRCGFASFPARSIRDSLDVYEVKWARSRSIVKFDIECYARMRRGKYLVAIVTSNGRACLESLFRAGKLNAEYFDFTVTRDDTPLLKPSPVPLDIAFKLTRQESPEISKIWFVGDSENDQQAADEFAVTIPVDFTFFRVGQSVETGIGDDSCATVDPFIEKLLIEAESMATDGQA